MRFLVRRSTLVLGCFCLLSVASGCSTGRHRTLLADGSYEVKCEGSLAQCLLQMEQVCTDNGYDVLRATEKRERNGPPELQTEIVRSQGIVRCRKSNALFTAPPQTPEPPPVPTEAPAPLPDHAPLPPLHAPPSSATPAPASAPATPTAPPSSATPSPPTPKAPPSPPTDTPPTPPTAP
jgi:hypothetical protein